MDASILALETTELLFNSGQLTQREMIILAQKTDDPRIYSTLVDKLVKKEGYTENLIALLANTNCSDLWQVFINIFRAKLANQDLKLDNKQLLAFAKAGNYDNFWEIIAQNLDLSSLTTTEALFNFGLEANNNFIYKRLEEEIDLSGHTTDQLMILAKKFSESNWVIRKIVATGRLDNQQIMEIVDLPYDLKTEGDSWIEHLNLEGLKPEEALELGEEARNIHLWIEILKKCRLDNDSIFEACRKSGGKLWYFTAPYLKLDGKTSEELMTLGREADNEHVWKAIVKTNKLSSAQLMKICSLEKKWLLSIAIAERVDLTQVSQRELIDLAFLVNSGDFWNKVARVLQY
jgi:hypothetical protein